MELLTNEIRKSIPKLYSQEKLGDCAVVYAKFFDPCSNWTWYATEFDGKDLFFGYVCGFVNEWGYFSLRELQSIKGRFGLGIERDLYFTPITIKEVKQQLGIETSDCSDQLQTTSQSKKSVDIFPSESIRDEGMLKRDEVSKDDFKDLITELTFNSKSEVSVMNVKGTLNNPFGIFKFNNL